MGLEVLDTEIANVVITAFRYQYKIQKLEADGAIVLEMLLLGLRRRTIIDLDVLFIDLSFNFNGGCFLFLYFRWLL